MPSWNSGRSFRSVRHTAHSCSLACCFTRECCSCRQQRRHDRNPAKRQPQRQTDVRQCKQQRVFANMLRIAQALVFPPSRRWERGGEGSGRAGPGLVSRGAGRGFRGSVGRAAPRRRGERVLLDAPDALQQGLAEGGELRGGGAAQRSGLGRAIGKAGVRLGPPASLRCQHLLARIQQGVIAHIRIRCSAAGTAGKGSRVLRESLRWPPPSASAPPSSPPRRGPAAPRESCK